MEFTTEHRQFRKLVRSFVENEINPHVEAWEAAGMMPLHDIFKQMAELGFIGLEYDPTTAAKAPTTSSPWSLAEEFGSADHGSIGMALGVQVDMATPSLHRFGSPEAEGAVPGTGARAATWWLPSPSPNPTPAPTSPPSAPGPNATATSG